MTAIMPEYEHESFQEFRLEDYSLKKDIITRAHINTNGRTVEGFYWNYWAVNEHEMKCKKIIKLLGGN